MSANVESMMFAGALPWHGEGNKIADDMLYDTAEGIKTAGMDWEVGLKDLQTVDGVSVPNKACYRKSDNKILGVVGPRWTPVQNWHMFDWFQPMLDAKLAKLHTAGSLCGGTKVWVLAELAMDNLEIVKGDEVAPFVLLANSHDGSMAVRAGFTPIRVVCTNTLRMAVGDVASKLIRIRHSTKVVENLDAVREIMNLAKQSFEATAEQYRLLSRKAIHSGDLRKYVKIVLGIENVADSDLPKKTTNIMEEIFAMVEGGRGQDNPLVKGTFWAAYNGVTEYLNYNKGRNVSNRLDSLWFGQAGTLSANALDTAMKMAG